MMRLEFSSSQDEKRETQKILTDEIVNSGKISEWELSVNTSTVRESQCEAIGKKTVTPDKT
jgi:hypothetical protein